jgi:hypothetical protein
MNTFKKLLSIISLFAVTYNYSQINLAISNPKKITFTYQTVPNIYFIEDKLYGDTLILKRFLKKTKFQLTKSTSDSTKIIGFVQSEQIKKKDLRELKVYISHSFPLMHGTYIVKEKKQRLKQSLVKATVNLFLQISLILQIFNIAIVSMNTI